MSSMPLGPRVRNLAVVLASVALLLSGCSDDSVGPPDWDARTAPFGLLPLESYPYGLADWKASFLWEGQDGSIFGITGGGVWCREGGVVQEDYSWVLQRPDGSYETGGVTIPGLACELVGTDAIRFFNQGTGESTTVTLQPGNEPCARLSRRLPGRALFRAALPSWGAGKIPQEVELPEVGPMGTFKDATCGVESPFGGGILG